MAGDHSLEQHGSRGVYPLVVLFLLTPRLLEDCFVYIRANVCIYVYVCICECACRDVRHRLMSVWERCGSSPGSSEGSKTPHPTIPQTQMMKPLPRKLFVLKKQKTG